MFSLVEIKCLRSEGELTKSVILLLITVVLIPGEECVLGVDLIVDTKSRDGYQLGIGNRLTELNWVETWVKNLSSDDRAVAYAVTIHIELK